MRLLTLIVFLLFSLVLSSEEEAKPIDEFEFIDKKLISEANISELTFTISKKDRSSIVDDDSYSCIGFTAKFDKKSNLIRYSMNRVGSDNYYAYDESGSLIDWGWEDKQNGELESHAQGINADVEKYEAERASRENDLKSMLDSKVDYRPVVVRRIADTCYSISANYRITHKNTGKLPKQAIAEWVSEVGGMMREPNFRSAEKLYIYYDYTYHD